MKHLQLTCEKLTADEIDYNALAMDTQGKMIDIRSNLERYKATPQNASYTTRELKIAEDLNDIAWTVISTTSGPSDWNQKFFDEVDQYCCDHLRYARNLKVLLWELLGWEA